MAELLKKFTIVRNILASNTSKSAERVSIYIGLVGDGLDQGGFQALTKGERNDISALANYNGLFATTEGGGYGPTKLNYFYRDLEKQNLTDAWQWLITRTLWHNVIPNGTASPINQIAKKVGVELNFFQKILSLLLSLSALSNTDRFLYFHEICLILDDDANWNDSAFDLFQNVLELRKDDKVNRARYLIDDLETEFDISRDNLNTVLVKAFRQTGLFEYFETAGRIVGIAFATDLSEVLQKRIRHILDNPLDHADPESEWDTFLGEHANDLPLEVEQNSELKTSRAGTSIVPSEDLVQLCDDAWQDFSNAGLRFEKEFIRRFFSACLAKPFVILTGLSGSGKTKLAEAVATWMTGHPALAADPFRMGETIEAVRKDYRVYDADTYSIILETQSPDGEREPKITTLPRALIREWADAIKSQGFDSNTSARDIREHVATTTNHDLQINAFESHLKACAFALIKAEESVAFANCYKLVPVGPDWISGEYILGYPDALNTETYIRRPALDVILAALRKPGVPHFLILDEMNLSHVERYFAEILSAIETTQPIELYSQDEGDNRSGVPPLLGKLPENLFIIGTVNVDETTYMFSPKVLDRANVIEFRVSKEEMQSFLVNPEKPDLDVIAGKGAQYAKAFVDAAMQKDVSLGDEVREQVSTVLMEFFPQLKEAGSEFGYRTAFEISRFISFHKEFTPADIWSLDIAMDAAIMQKLLPKLHGSKKRLGPVLASLIRLCLKEHVRPENDPIKDEVLVKENSRYWNSLEKLARMRKRLGEHGFTSFAEA